MARAETQLTRGVILPKFVYAKLISAARNVMMTVFGSFPAVRPIIRRALNITRQQI